MSAVGATFSLMEELLLRVKPPRSIPLSRNYRCPLGCLNLPGDLKVHHDSLMTSDIQWPSVPGSPWGTSRVRPEAAC